MITRAVVLACALALAGAGSATATFTPVPDPPTPSPTDTSPLLTDAERSYWFGSWWNGFGPPIIQQTSVASSSSGTQATALVDQQAGPSTIQVEYWVKSNRRFTTPWTSIGAGLRSVPLSQGPITTSNALSDVAINGEGYFIEASRLNVGTPSAYRYTRDGQFAFNANGEFVNVDGLLILGYRADSKTGDPDTAHGLQPVSVPSAWTTDIRVGQDGRVTYTDLFRYPYQTMTAGYIAVGLIPSPGAMGRDGKLLVTTEASGAMIPATDWMRPSLLGGWLENQQGGSLVGRPAPGTHMTGVQLDIAIDGSGYLLVTPPGGRQADAQLQRQGDLHRDRDGWLVTRDGWRVLGWPERSPRGSGVADRTAPLTAVRYGMEYRDVSVTPDGRLVGLNRSTGMLEALLHVALADLPDGATVFPTGGQRLGSTSQYTLHEAGDAGGIGTIVAGALDPKVTFASRYSVTFPALTAGKRYHYRVRVTNPLGTTTSATATFVAPRVRGPRHQAGEACVRPLRATTRIRLAAGPRVVTLPQTSSWCRGRLPRHGHLVHWVT